jgi:hypothetical protein
MLLDSGLRRNDGGISNAVIPAQAGKRSLMFIIRRSKNHGIQSNDIRPLCQVCIKTSPEGEGEQ